MLELLLSFAPTLLLQGASLPNEGFSDWLLATRGEVYQTEFIRHRLVLHAASAEELTPSPAEVEEALDAEISRRVENAHLGDRAAWLAELKRLGLDEERWRTEQRPKTLSSILVNSLAQARRVITEPELIEAWEERYGPNGEQTVVRWIQVKIEPPTPPPGITREEERALRDAAREVARERAVEVMEAWRAGAEFDALRGASGSGEEPQAPFRLNELTWPELVRREVARMQPDEISEPQAARGGWSIFQLVEKERTPLEGVREELLADLAVRPANSAEADALFAELLERGAPAVALPPGELPSNANESTMRIGQVAGEAVSLSSFSRWLTETQGRPHLESYKRAQLVSRMAAALGAEFTAEEVSARMDSDLTDRLSLFYEGDRARWLEDLRMDGRTLAGWRREASIRARHDLCAEAILMTRRVITEEELRAEWERVFGPGGEARTVRWIFLRPPAPPEDLEVSEFEAWLSETLMALEREAVELRERVVESGEDFGTLAKRRSGDPETRDAGGLLPGVFDPRVYSAPVAAAVTALKSGEVSQPVRLSGGFGLYQVIKIKRTPLKDVQEELRADLMSRRPSAVELAGFVNQLYEESKR